MTSSETEVWTEVWRLRTIEAAPQIQKLSITNQAMDWSGIAVASSSFHATCIFEYYIYFI